MTVHIIISEKETAVLQNIKRKEAEAEMMTGEMIKFMGKILKNEIPVAGCVKDDYSPMTVMLLPNWIGAV